jgi:hypothetical protein
VQPKGPKGGAGPDRCNLIDHEDGHGCHSQSAYEGHVVNPLKHVRSSERCQKSLSDSNLKIA